MGVSKSAAATGEAAAISYDRYGSGPPLMLIHPIGSERGFWNVVIDRLAAERDVIVPDLPGFGESPALPPMQAPTPSRLAASLAGLLDDLGIAHAHAAGSSLGAWVALELAVIGRALTVTAMCPSGLGPDRPIPNRPPRLAVPLLPLLLRSNRFRRLVLGGVIAHPERAPLDALVRFSRSMATAPAFDVTYREMRVSRFADWDSVSVPTTLAYGEHDTQITPVSDPRPGIRMETLADCGHIPVFDNPSEVVRVLLAGSAAT